MAKKSDIDPALAEAFKKLRKQYGDDAIFMADDAPEKVDSVSTGCYAIDGLLGCGGLPRGRIIEIFGQESSGKSTACLFFIGQVQKQGGMCLYIDAENSFDANYARNIGVDMSKLLVTQPTTLEEAMDTVRDISNSNAVDLIVVDSVAAMVPKATLQGDEMLKDTVALQARLMSKALQILTGEIARAKTVVIFINQLREQIDLKWGKRETTPGGKALKFYSSVRLQVNKSTKLLNDKDEQIGNTVIIKAVKNKVGFPFKEGKFDLYYGSGVDLHADTLDTALERGVINKKGNTYEFNEQKLGVGREQARRFLRENNSIYTEVRTLLDRVIAEQGNSPEPIREADEE